MFQIPFSIQELNCLNILKNNNFAYSSYNESKVEYEYVNEFFSTSCLKELIIYNIHVVMTKPEIKFCHNCFKTQKYFQSRFK